MDNVINVYNLFFDSKYKLIDSENKHPEFELDNQIALTDPNNYFDFELVAADVPFSFYSFDAPNNVVKVLLQRGSTSWHGEITVPPGNYNINTLCDALVQTIATAWQNLPVGVTPTLVYVYDQDTGKVTFSLTGSSAYSFTIVIEWQDYDIFAQYFGFSFTVSTALNLQFGVPYYSNNASPYCVCVNPITSLYLRSLTLNQSLDNQENLVDLSSSQSNILGKVPIDVASMNWIYFATNDFKVKLRNSEIKRFDLFWTGLTYDEIRFRGVFWKIQVRIREMQPQIVSERNHATSLAEKQAEMEAKSLNAAKRQLAEEASKRVNKIRKKVASKLPID